jgi:hypothetical protein
VRVSWSQALAWRLRRQLLEPAGTESVEDVVRRLGAVQAQDGAAAELSVRTRRVRSEAGEVVRARADGRLIMTFSFRGATHLMTPEEAGIYLAVRMAGRQWELKSWREYYRLAPSDWPALREVVREALADRPLSVRELVAAIAARPRFAHLGPILAENPWSVMKVFAWHGDLSFGPATSRQQTVQPLDANPRWAGVPDLDDAGPRAVEAYVRTYGPSTPANIHYWLGAGLSAGRKRLDGWIGGLRDRLEEVDVEGTAALVLREDLDELLAARPSTVVMLLPAYDQWVFGPGTADAHVVPPAHRSLLSRGAAIVIVGGVVSGTWSIRDEEIVIEWFPGVVPPPGHQLDEEQHRLLTLSRVPSP